MNKSEAIAAHLNLNTHSDLAILYNLHMECQVNVAQDGGERVEGDFKGRKWHGWSDGLTTWKSFRIPLKANSEPEYADSAIKFDISAHAEGIGMTGWDWSNRCSLWVAFDFDAIASGHSKGLTKEELDTIVQILSNIPWVTIRRSTSGRGLHVYVFLPKVPTENHNVHAALARAILGKLSALTGFDFNTKVDICGGNMWVWHRKMRGTDGLKIIKQGCVLEDIPANWRDHIKVVTGHRRKNLPHELEESGAAETFEALCSQRPHIQLDEEHKKLIKFLEEDHALWWWDKDHHMLVTHTTHLKDAHKNLKMKGVFETTSQGKDKGADHNCFLFPIRNGAWCVRRYGMGVQEHDSWTQDSAGWTRCYLNREPDLATAAKSSGGLEDPTGGFVFRQAETAIKTASMLGANFDVPAEYKGRETKLKEHKDGRLVVEIEKKDNDNLPGWLPKRGKWVKLFNAVLAPPSEPEVGNYDDLIRHLISGTEDAGWRIKSDGEWRIEPKHHIKDALVSTGIGPQEVTPILGSSVLRPWKLVVKPFQPEYPGDREWNLNAAQLRFVPSQNRDSLSYPSWLKILKHCGSGLDEFLKYNPWAKANGILTGADYLKCWIASVFKFPLEPLPYLFLYGPQNSGKSILHEALALLLTKGAQRADTALISQGSFNGELEGAVICIVEEVNLQAHKQAYDRIKDWVTSRELLIHPKTKTPYHVPNTTHWIQCANPVTYCPVFTGDTRITMLYVKALDPLELIPKRQMIQNLEREASDFLAEILSLELPESNDRLNIPALMTEDKLQAEDSARSTLTVFLEEYCTDCVGYSIKFSDFYDRFVASLDTSEARQWSKIRVSRELPPTLQRGRRHEDNQLVMINIRWKDIDDLSPKPRLTIKDGLVEVLNATNS